jgi:uncharacterized protein YidB (DUF937 family)
MGARRHAVRDFPISAEQVRKGLPVKALEALAGSLGIDRAELAEALSISLRVRKGPRCLV